MNILDLLDEIQTQDTKCNVSTNPFEVQKQINVLSSSKKIGNEPVQANNPFFVPRNYSSECKENFNIQASSNVNMASSRGATCSNQFGAQPKLVSSNHGFSDWNMPTKGQAQNSFSQEIWPAQKPTQSSNTVNKQNDFSSFSSFNLGWDNWQATSVVKEPIIIANSSFGSFEKFSGSTLTESRNFSTNTVTVVKNPQNNTQRDLTFVNNKNAPFTVKLDSKMDNKSCLNLILTAMNEMDTTEDLFFESERGERIEAKEVPGKLINSTSNGYFLLKKTDLHAFFDEEDRNQKTKLEIDPLEHYEIQEAFNTLVEGVKILKLSGSGKLSLRYLQILPGHNKLVLYSNSKPLNEMCIQYSKIKEIKIGQKSEEFKALKYLGNLNHLSCSLIYDDVDGFEECLNFICKTQDEYDKVVAALKALSSKAKNKLISKSVLLSHSEAYSLLLSEKRPSSCSLFRAASVSGGIKFLNQVSELKMCPEIIALLIKYTPSEYGKGFFMEEVDKLIHESRLVKKAMDIFENGETILKNGFAEGIPSELDLEAIKVSSIYKLAFLGLTSIVNKVIDHYDPALLNYFNYNPPAFEYPIAEFQFSIVEEDMLKELQFLIWWVCQTFNQTVKIAENISKARKSPSQRVKTSIGSFFENTKKNFSKGIKNLETAVEQMGENMGSQNVAAFDKFSKDITHFNQTVSSTFKKIFGK